MNKIIMCGDLHGDFKPVRDIHQKLIEENLVNDENVLICLGDFGGNFFFNHRDDNFKTKLGKYHLTYFVIRGNHEQRPSICAKEHPQEWHIEKFWDSNVYVENIYPYIKYALDIPTVYKIPTVQNGKIKTLVLPGAYSADKYYRLERGWSWFKQEQLNNEEMTAGSILALSDGWDLILSHTCPIAFEPTDLFLPIVDQSTVDKTMERWMGGLEYQMSYKLWCWGHYHANRIYPKFDSSDRLMLFNDCYFDVYKYFCENHKIIDCLTKTNNNATFVNLDRG